MFTLTLQDIRKEEKLEGKLFFSSKDISLKLHVIALVHNIHLDRM